MRICNHHGSVHVDRDSSWLARFDFGRSPATNKFAKLIEHLNSTGFVQNKDLVFLIDCYGAWFLKSTVRQASLTKDQVGFCPYVHGNNSGAANIETQGRCGYETQRTNQIRPNQADEIATQGCGLLWTMAGVRLAGCHGKFDSRTRWQPIGGIDRRWFIRYHTSIGNELRKISRSDRVSRQLVSPHCSHHV